MYFGRRGDPDRVFAIGNAKDGAQGLCACIATIPMREEEKSENDRRVLLIPAIYPVYLAPEIFKFKSHFFVHML